MDVPDATHPGKARNLPNHQVGVRTLERAEGPVVKQQRCFSHTGNTFNKTHDDVVVPTRVACPNVAFHMSNAALDQRHPTQAIAHINADELIC